MLATIPPRIALSIPMIIPKDISPIINPAVPCPTVHPPTFVNNANSYARTSRLSTPARNPVIDPINNPLNNVPFELNLLARILYPK